MSLTLADLHIHPNDPDNPESVFEAYHSIFSAMTSTDIIYVELAKICGCNFHKLNDNEEHDIVVPNTIFCHDSIETHYCYKDTRGKIHDPYDYFQIPQSHGNCFAYALYFAFTSNRGSLRILIHTEDVIETKKTYETIRKKRNTIKYKKVKNDKKQLAYKIFVYNDFTVIQWLVRLINENYKVLIAKYEEEWDTMSPDEKHERGIPNTYKSIKKLTSKSSKKTTRKSSSLRSYDFDRFFREFQFIASDMLYTHELNWYTICSWDEQLIENPSMKPYENAGIEGATTGSVNKDDYDITLRLMSMDMVG
jgi:hypothetical protein